VLAPNENQIQIDFVGLEFGIGQGLRYQYRLEEPTMIESASTDLRTINYASLRSETIAFWSVL